MKEDNGLEQKLKVAQAAPLDKLPSPPMLRDQYRLIWADEFSGHELDMSKWEYRLLGPRRDAINVKDAISLDDKGHLVLATKRVGLEYYTAMLGTEGTFQTAFGYFECRAKLQKQVGHWSAFWLQTASMGQSIGNVKEAGAEIDIFEYLRREGDNVHHTLHWDGYGKDHKSDHKFSHIPGLGTGWHTFGLLWSKDSYVFYVDGRETWQTIKGVSHRPQYMVLSLEVGKWAGDISKANLPDSFFIDYVRVYREH